MIHFDMTNKEFRRLLDLVYIGNWVLNSARGDDRIDDYDRVESLVFAQCLQQEGTQELYDIDGGVVVPSAAFAEGRDRGGWLCDQRGRDRDGHGRYARDADMRQQCRDLWGPDRDRI